MENGVIGIGDKFTSFTHLEAKIRAYELRNKCEVYKRDSRTISSARSRGIKREINDALKFYSIRYSCINGGKFNLSKSSGKRPKQRTFRQGCPAYISIGVSDDGQYLVVKDINEQHNHDVSKGLFDMLPRERRLPEADLKEAEKLVGLQVNNKLMREHSETKTGKKIILKDISNIITKVNSATKTDNLESLASKLEETDLHLKSIKEKEFPPFVSNKKGCGKKSLKVTNSNNITSSENVGHDNGINWVEVAKENIDKLRKFVDSHEPDKCLPSVGESITRYYEDRTKSLSEKERTLLIYYLCRTFKKLRIPTTKVTYLLHDTIGFLMNGCKEYDIQQEESVPVQPKPTEHHFTAEKIVNISDIKLPAKLRMKGRPKGSNLTVIGLSKKSKTNRKPKPFFKRCNKEKQKVILEWIVGRELAEMATNGHTIEKADIEEKSLLTACLDSYVDMELVKQFFSSDGWDQVTSFIQRKRDKPDYSCDVCKHSIDFDAVNVVCDSCLNIFHLQCVQLKNVPKVKHWFCKNCK